MMHSAMENLAEDHRTIERVLAAMHTTSHRLLADRPVEVGVLRQSLAFLEGFLEHCHYPKEEEFLFPALKTVPRFIGARPVAELTADHERTRRHFGELKKALTKLEGGERQAAWNAAVALATYQTTLSTHLHEEERLFPYADEALGSADLNRMMAGFAKIEAGADGRPQLHEAYQAVAEDIAAALAAMEEAATVGVAA